MAGIQKVFLNDGLKATAEAKSAIKRVAQAVKKEIIPESQLVRQPSSDLFEKACYMREASFWDNPQNIANYARGQYLTEGGKAVQKAQKIGNTVIERTPDLERGFSIYPGLDNSCVVYYEKNLLNGNVERQVTLMDGHPFKGVMQDGKEITYNMRTGVPIEKELEGYPRKILHYAEDGVTPRDITTYNKGRRIVQTLQADGETPLQRKFYNENGKLTEIISYHGNGKEAKKIMINPITGNIEEVKYYDTKGKYLTGKWS